MTYKHILVAVDLSEESHLLIEKAADLAKGIEAQLSLIYIDVIQDDEFTRQIVSSFVKNGDETKTYQESQQLLDNLKKITDYPIEQTLVGFGGLSQELETAIDEYEFDLIVCGHHQSFWHSLSSSTKKVMHTIPVDMLVIPLNKE